MDDPTLASDSPQPAEVETACGTRVMLSRNTPQAVYADKPVYFCMPECKETYENDPLNSCMAARILLDQR